MLYNIKRPTIVTWAAAASIPINSPINNMGQCLIIPHYWGVIEVVVGCRYYMDKIYIREYWAGSANVWNDWKTITLTTLQ